MYSRCNWLDHPFIVDVTLSFVPYRWLIISLAILNWAFYPIWFFFNFFESLIFFNCNLIPCDIWTKTKKRKTL